MRRPSDAETDELLEGHCLPYFSVGWMNSSNWPAPTWGRPVSGEYLGPKNSTRLWQPDLLGGRKENPPKTGWKER